MVITMNWTSKYQNRDEFLTWFLHEREYVDAMFVQIVMFNFGVWVNAEELQSGPDEAGYLDANETPSR